MSEVEECKKNLYIIFKHRFKQKFKHSNPVKIFHVRNIENLMGTDNLEEFLRSCSS